MLPFAFPNLELWEYFSLVRPLALAQLALWPTVGQVKTYSAESRLLLLIFIFALCPAAGLP
jgi:hypothetical protein